MATKRVAKKPAAKKPVVKKPVAKTSVAKTSVARQPVARQPVAKQPVAEKPVAKKPAAKPADGRPKTSHEFKPFVLMEHGSPSEWELLLSDGDSPIELFEEEGHSGNGYAWDSVARVAMRGLPESQADTIDFDSEAGTFVARSEDKESIVALAAALHALMQSRKLLRAAIRAVPDGDWDD